jgi:hypothetical protein
VAAVKQRQNRSGTTSHEGRCLTADDTTRYLADATSDRQRESHE